jgi:hypothetical protein
MLAEQWVLARAGLAVDTVLRDEPVADGGGLKPRGPFRQTMPHGFTISTW